MALNTLSTLNDPDWIKLFTIMESPDVSECQVNGPDSVWVKHKGKRRLISDISWRNDEEYAESVRNALGGTGFISSHMPYDEMGALFEGPIAYKGSKGKIIRGRAHLVLPPASSVPLLTFAKKSQSLVTLDAIADKGSMNEEMLRFIKAAIYSDLTAIVSGGTGTGKTTFLEASTKLFPEDIRVGVCEDTPELELRQKNVAYMHSLPWRPGMDPNNVATLSWIVQQVNRMRTDRVLVGETRGKEFADFLVAANSGMDGSLTTIHANDPISCLSKMTNFALKGNGENVPIRAINSDIAQAVDLIIQLAYDAPTGRHYVHSIVEVTNTVSDKPDAPITTGTLYRYNHADGLHEKVDAPGDILRRKLINAGIDASEFTGAAQGFGTEPKWLPGKGPADAEPKAERTLASGAKSVKKGGSRNIGRSI